MDPDAENFNSNANEDDGSCVYAAQDQLRITVRPSYGSEEFFLDSIYTSAQGYLVKFSDLKFYISELRNGEDLLCDAALYDFRETQYGLVNKAGDFSKFANLSGNIGIDSLVNHSDPSAFANDSPLNISNAGLMHWGWNTGYIFISVEGKVDTLATGDAFNHNFSFHIGTDQFLQTFEFTNLTWSPSDGGYEIEWHLDMAEFLNSSSSPIDLKNEFLTHSGSGQLILAEKVKNNFLNALTP